jgi:hypothetical protein
VVRTSECPGEKHYPWISSNECLRSCKRGWNKHWFMPYNFNGRFRNTSVLGKIFAKTRLMILKSLPKNKWRRKSLEISHYWWQDMGLRLWRWNQTTILTLEESCFASLQESTTGALTSGSNAALFFDHWGIVLYEFTPEGHTIMIFTWQFWDVCGIWYEESHLKCGLQEAGSSVTIMSLLTHCCQVDNSSQNIQFLPFHNPLLTWPLPSRLFSIF